MPDRECGQFPAQRFLLHSSRFHRAVLPASAFCSTVVLRLRGPPGDERREVARRIQISVYLRSTHRTPDDTLRQRHVIFDMACQRSFNSTGVWSWNSPGPSLLDRVRRRRPGAVTRSVTLPLQEDMVAGVDEAVQNAFRQYRVRKQRVPVLR